MKLEWSHTVLNIKDSEKIIEFYTKTLGFKISDRGPIVENGPEIIFVSQDPDEHHQLAFSVEREDVDKPISLNHLSFRVKTFDEVQEVKKSWILLMSNIYHCVMAMPSLFTLTTLKEMVLKFFLIPLGM